MSEQPAGFREIAHIADWELQVWGADLSSLFEQAARGMYALCAAHWLGSKTHIHALTLEALDAETLLVKFLSELLYVYEEKRIGFQRFAIEINHNLLRAELEGSEVAVFSKEIKAVTYHNLLIRQTARGFEANIVFDV